MYIKIHKNYDRSIIAVCDKELVGKKISEGKLCLDITERFYKGKEKSEEEIEEILEGASNINFVGEKSVALGMKLGLIKKEKVVTIKGVPHAQFILF